MTFRSSLLVAFSALVLAAAAGCSADATDGATASSAADSTSSLSDDTIVKGELPIGTTTVGYTATEYTVKQVNGVPYLAWEIPATTTGATLAITVEGQFPGTPDVLVTDTDFNILGQTKAQTTNLGEKATLQVDAHDGSKKLVLVRDNIWVAPMSFDITIAE